MNTFYQDLRFTMRLLVKNPGFLAVVVVTLALCIGLNTAIFSIVNTMIYFPLPFPEPDRLIRVHRTSLHAQNWPHAIGDYLDFQGQNRVFAQMAAFHFDGPTLTHPDGLPESLQGMRVSANFFDVLGLAPLWGRSFRADENEPGKSSVVMLRERFWERRFGGDTNVVGQTLRLGGNSVTVVGVVPERITHFRMWGEIDVWRALTIQPESREQHDPRFLSVIGRLKSGISLAQAQANLSAVATRIAEEHPTSFNKRENVRLEKLQDSFSSPVDAARCHMMLAIAGCVLLIGCVNVANLQLARAVNRTREMGIRTALGASRSRLLRQGMRSVWAGLAIGLAGAYALVHALRPVLYGIPLWDVPTLTAALLVLLVAAALACYLPARRAIRIEPMQALRCE